MSSNWEEIGTVVGSTSTDSYGFVLSSLKGSVGDIVITETIIPDTKRGEKKVHIWGRIVSMDRSNPTFPNEAAIVNLSEILSSKVFELQCRYLFLWGDIV